MIAFNILFDVWWWNILYLIGGSKWKKRKTWEERKKKPIWKLPLLGSCSNGMKGDRFFHFIKNIMVTHESHSEPSQTSKVRLFAKIINGLKSLIVFARSSILDDWFGSEYVCFVRKKEHFVSISVSFRFVSFQKKTLVR